MNVGKASRGNGKGGKGWRSVMLNLAPLAVKTCAGPLSYIAVDVGPDISFSNETLSCFDTKMR